MNDLCKQYITEVKLLLPAVGKSEKHYLATLQNNLADFCEDVSPQTIHDLYNKFGTPADTASSYITTLPAKDLLKRLQIRKFLRLGTYCLAVGISCISIFFGIYLYHEYRIFEDEKAVFTTTVVTDPATN